MPQLIHNRCCRFFLLMRQSVGHIHVSVENLTGMNSNDLETNLISIRKSFVKSELKIKFYFQFFVFNHTAADIPRCHAGDTVCLPKVITEIVQQHPNGHTGLSIPPMEPLHINRIDISQGRESPIAINLNLKDLDLSGLSKAVINRVV